MVAVRVTSSVGLVCFLECLKTRIIGRVVVVVGSSGPLLYPHFSLASICYKMLQQNSLQ